MWKSLCLFAILAMSAGASAEEKKEYTIAEFRSAYRGGGLYTLKAYAVEVFECPECPPGALCKPCADAIVFADMPERCATPPCPNEFRLVTNDANHFAAARRAGSNPLLVDIRLGGATLDEVRDLEAARAVEEMLKKDPELRKKNPIKWMQEHYDLQDKSLQLNR